LEFSWDFKYQNMYRLLFLFFLLASANVYCQQIEFFDGTWEEALEKAKEENKGIFVDIYTTWCGPCKQLDKTTFKDPELSSFINENFIPVKVEAENGKHRNLAFGFNIGGYPVMIFMDRNGIQKIQARGFKKPFALKAIGQFALNEIALDTQLVALINAEIADLEKEELSYLIAHYDEFHSNLKGSWLAKYHNALSDEERIAQSHVYIRSYPFLSEGLKSYYVDKFQLPNFFDENRSEKVNDQFRAGREIERDYKIALGGKNKKAFIQALSRRMDYAVKTKQISIEEKEFLRNGYIEEYEYKHGGH